MAAGAMGVAVNHRFNAVFAHQCRYSGGGDIHNASAFITICGHAFSAPFNANILASFKWQASHDAEY